MIDQDPQKISIIYIQLHEFSGDPDTLPKERVSHIFGRGLSRLHGQTLDADVQGVHLKGFVTRISVHARSGTWWYNLSYVILYINMCMCIYINI